jgi:hypothetical protein
MIYIDTKLLIVAIAVLTVGLIFARWRGKVAVPFFLALGLAIVWSYYFKYEYNQTNVFLFDRINIYPLALWTLGLTSLQVLSRKVIGRYRILIVTGIYLIALFILETIGYHVLNIRLSSHYPSLFNLGVIHAPTTVKIFYIVAGPIYLLLLQWIYRMPIFSEKNGFKHL